MRRSSPVGVRGLGLAMARRLGRDGYSLVLASRRREHLDPAVEDLRNVGVDAHAIPTDVRDPEQVQRLVSQSIESVGPHRCVDQQRKRAISFVRPRSCPSEGWKACARHCARRYLLLLALCWRDHDRKTDRGDHQHHRQLRLGCRSRGRFIPAMRQGWCAGHDPNPCGGMGALRHPGQRGFTGAGGYTGGFGEAVAHGRKPVLLWRGTIPSGRLGKPEEIAAAVSFFGIARSIVRQRCHAGR